ncbi:helix-turn-helix transcriptional regulator [Nocardia sp. NPDC057668]|uniref:helix-turn-helix transcriptional regulator n=1 Tax=Nocardia sp. NPDC057668 TaxID=3346202 RepID=UPI003672CF0E
MWEWTAVTMSDPHAEYERSSATIADRLAREIKTRRIEAGLSQRVLATQIGYSRQYVSMTEWEDSNLPSVELIAALDAALGARGELVAIRAQANAPRLSFEKHVVTGEVGLDAWDERSDAVPLTLDPVESLVRSKAITEQTIASFTAVTRLLASQRQSIAPEALVGLIATHRDSVAELFRAAGDDRTRTRLGTLLGETSIVASRLWSAVGDRPMALANCVYARRLADRLGHRLLSGVARIFESNLRSDAATLIGAEGDLVSGLQLLRDAAKFSDSLPPAARARIAAEQAQHYAVLDLRSECENRLRVARRAVDDIDDTATSGLFSDWNSTRLRVYEGTCRLFLDEPRKAIAALEPTVRDTDPGNLNVRLAAQVDLASAYALNRELEEGCRLLGETYGSLAAMGNRRGLERARRAVERLEPWRTERPVRELAQRVATYARR